MGKGLEAGFYYINSRLIDSKDEKDYLEEGYDEEWDEISVVPNKL